LIKLLEDKEENVRSSAAEALGKIPDHSAVEPLIQMLWDEKPNARQLAAFGLGQIGDSRAVEPLIELLGDGEKYVRYAATEALGEIADLRAVEPLIQLLGDGDGFLRYLVATAIGKIGDPRALQSLIKLFRDENYRAREAAVSALGKMGEPAVECLIKLLQGETFGPPGFFAPEELSVIAGERVVKDHVFCDGDEPANIRLYADRALCKIGAPSVGPLIELLSHENPAVRASAAADLGQIGDMRALEPLILSLWDAEESVLERVSWALGLIDPYWDEKESLLNYLGYFSEALKKGSIAVKLCIIEVLQEIGHTSVSEILKSAMEADDKTVRLRAAKALAIIGSTASQ
jgi:HEAT repeat protein